MLPPTAGGLDKLFYEFPVRPDWFWGRLIVRLVTKISFEWQRSSLETKAGEVLQCE